MDAIEFFSNKLPQALSVIEKLRTEDTCDCTFRLANEEIRSIYFYTTEHDDYSYKKINRLLDRGDIEASELHHQVSKIDSGLQALSPYEGQCLRGEELGGYIHSKAQDILQRQPNTPETAEMIEYLCTSFFMSSTLNLQSNLLKRDVKIVVQSKGGARDISHLSGFYDEKEFLFQRNTKFIITEVEQFDNKSFVINLLEV